MFRFALKLKRLRTTLKNWNATSVGNIFQNLGRAEEELQSMERVFEMTGSDADLIALNRCQASYFHALADEELFWKQKTKTKWLAAGDQNTKFFHATVQARRSRMTITRIKDASGTWLNDLEDIKSHGLEFFQHLLSAPPTPPDVAAIETLLQHIPEIVSAQDNKILLRPIELAEVRSAVFGLDVDSAPGPDGFTGIFYRHCWDIIAKGLLSAVQEFMAGVPLPRMIASALMVLIPKKG